MGRYKDLISNVKIPASAVAPARRTRLWEEGLRAGRQMPNEFQMTKFHSLFLAI
jgi:hypothetical protein